VSGAPATISTRLLCLFGRQNTGHQKEIRL
jgi:hypothetical protein